MGKIYRKDGVLDRRFKRKIKRTCAVCKSRFVPKGEHIGRIQKYCSKKCWSIRGEYRKIKCKLCKKNIPIRAKEFCSRNCSFLYRKNENHHAWKGDKASYSAVHKWASTNFIKNDLCFNCTNNKPRTEWANISLEYKRDRSDWIELCSSCHRFFDKRKSFRDVIIERWEKFTGNKAELIPSSNQ